MKLEIPAVPEGQAVLVGLEDPLGPEAPHPRGCLCPPSAPGFLWDPGCQVDQ